MAVKISRIWSYVKFAPKLFEDMQIYTDHLGEHHLFNSQKLMGQ